MGKLRPEVWRSQLANAETRQDVRLTFGGRVVDTLIGESVDPLHVPALGRQLWSR